MSDATGLLSPSTKNLVIGKGILLFKLEGEEDFRHLGNVPNFTWTPAVEKLEHFSSMEGTKEKDATIITQKSATVKITMEEFTAHNLALLLMGDVDDDDPDNVTIDIFARTEIKGELRFYATNDQGPRWRLFLNQVQLTPSGDFSPISENFANMVVTGDVYSVDGVWGTAQLVKGAAPVNLTLPFITGDFLEGEILTVSNGGWLDVDTFTYQWQNEGVNISSATSKTYTVQAGDVGDSLTCVVTGTNDFGSDVAESDPIDITT